MKRFVKSILLVVSATILSALALADSYYLTISLGVDSYSIPTDSIDSLMLTCDLTAIVSLRESSKLTYQNIDSVTFTTSATDTLWITYKGNMATVINPRADVYHIKKTYENADIFVTIKENQLQPVISISGESSDGRLRVDSDVEYTLILDNVDLKSSHAPAINSTGKQKVKVELPSGTCNRLSDNKEYVFEDTLETAGGCLTSQGSLHFSGDGELWVTGNNKHAVHSKKSIKLNSGIFHISTSASDAFHSGKSIIICGGEYHLDGMKGEAFDADEEFTMTGGAIDMNITGQAAKGIKCGGIMDISGGYITATASGALKNKDGELSYCTIMKCDSSAVISGGYLQLVNTSPGGKCISVNYNLTITGGNISVETSGDGAEYTNASGEKDYYTSKCLAADDSIFIYRGTLNCLSTGVGGKGIVADEYMQIGIQEDTAIEQGPLINVETTNSSIVNDVEEDLRYGCPKAIKSNQYLYIYSGDIHCTTAGMGGEGVECNKEMHIYGGNIECNCYDDGFNVGEMLVVNGGQIYCNSFDNDGIDSNGSITINGGLVAAVNQKKPNESFDTEKSQFYINGGVVFGIGSAMVKVPEQQSLYYNTLYNVEPDKPQARGLLLTSGKYAYIMKDCELLISLQTENENKRKFVTISLPEFVQGQAYEIKEGDMPFSPQRELFGGKCCLRGTPQNMTDITSFYPSYFNNI